MLLDTSVLAEGGETSVAVSGTDRSANTGRGVGSTAEQVDTVVTLCSSEMRDFLR